MFCPPAAPHTPAALQLLILLITVGRAQVLLMTLMMFKCSSESDCKPARTAEQKKDKIAGVVPLSKR